MAIVREEDLQIVLDSSIDADKLNDALNKYREVLLAPGTYNFGTDTISVPSNTVLRGYGEGNFGGVFLNSTLMSGTFITLNEESELHSVIVGGPGQGTGSAQGVAYGGASTNRCHVEWVVSRFWGTNGFSITGDVIQCQGNSNGAVGIRIDGRVDRPSIIANCRGSFNTTAGIAILGDPVNDFTIRDTIATFNGTIGLLVQSSGGSFNDVSRVTIRRITARANGDDGIRVFADDVVDTVFISEVDASFNGNRGIDVQGSGGVARIFISECIAASNTAVAEGIHISTPGTLTNGIIINCAATDNTGAGIVINPTTIDQCRITGCIAGGNGGIGIEGSGALLGASSDSAGHGVGNISRGNTGANFSFNGSWVTADNV